MSLYLDTWGKIKTLSYEDILAWIRTIAPAKGLMIDFYAYKLVDVDLLEYLTSQKEQLEIMETLRKRNNEAI